MDWTALFLSLRLAGWTVAILLPVSILAGRWLAYRQFRGKGLVEAIVMLPLVLPPTVFGFYLLVAFGRNSPIGAFWQATFAHTLGEFGIILMMGGSIPGETRTIAISIYDRVQGFDMAGAGVMSATLVAVSLFTIATTYMLSARVGRRLS